MMDSSILTDKEDHDTVMTSPPPTRVITVKNEYTVKDQDEMLALAQKKFDRMRQRNKERARSTRYQRLSRNSRLSSSKGMHNNQEQTKVNQILSSLLYLSLMMHKVDKMKEILEHHDSNVYNEWVMLLGSLHSPVFHMRERRMQNDKVKKIYNRKNKYKNQYEETKSDLGRAQDTLKELSLALSQLTEENKRTSSLLEEKQNVEINLAAITKESEIHKSNITKLEGELTSLKTECSGLHTTVESFQLKQGEQLEKIQTLEKEKENDGKKIASLEDETESKCKENQELECRIVAAEKDIETYKKDLNQAKSDHQNAVDTYDEQLKESKAKWEESQAALEQSKSSMVEMENVKIEEIGKLNDRINDLVKEVEVKLSELTMTQNELQQARGDLDINASNLTNTLSLLENERNAKALLQEKHDVAMNEISTLQLSVEKKNSENIILAQTIASLESQLKKSISDAENKFSTLDKDLKSKEGKIIQTEKEISDLICTNQSLERSLSEALLSKSSAEEEKQKLIDGEIKSVNLSIEELAAENLRITNMMESMKDSLMEDVHNALKQQKDAEEKAEMLQKDLVKSEKEVAVLRCENVSLEKSLSEVTQLKTCVEEQKQKLLDGETNSVNTSIAKLTAENLRINNMMGSMKDSLMKDVHDALEQQKLAQQKVDMLQTELVKSEKEVAVLRSKNISLEQSLAEALRLKLEAEEQTKKLNEENVDSVTSSIQKLSAENKRLSEMMGSMKETLMKDVIDVLSDQKETGLNEKVNPSVTSNGSQFVPSQNETTEVDSKVIDDSGPDADNITDTESPQQMNDVISNHANDVVSEVMSDAMENLTPQK